MVLNYVIIILLLVLSGLFSGLNLGLMTLDPYTLKRKAGLGNKNAAKIYPLRKKGNLLLCALLIGNAGVNAALAIFLGSVTTGIIAGIAATGLIVIFGEVLPQSIFSRKALKLGAKTIWLSWVFVLITYPIAKPISMVLDKALGGELPTVFSKREIRALIKEQHKLGEEIKEHEFEIVDKSLGFSARKVHQVMTPRKNVFFLKHNDVLGRNMLVSIQKAGHSRIPVYNHNKKKVVGILFSKDLVFINPAERIPVHKLMRKHVGRVHEHDHLDRVLRSFKEKRVHLFVVINSLRKMTGIITLEDVLEEIVGEIVDEHDRHVDMRKRK
jgi:metal transporter CNNM